MTMTHDEGNDLLQPHKPLLTKIVLDGIAAYDAGHYSPYVRVVHRTRTVSDIYNDHIVDQARRLFLDTLGTRVREREKHGRTIFIVDDKACLWFKKFDRNLRPRNIMTRQALNYVLQKPMFPDEPSLTNLAIGYRSIDPARTQHEVWATCPGLGANKWTIKLSGENMQTMFPDVENPAPIVPVAPARKPRVFPRRPEGVPEDAAPNTPDLAE